MRHSPTVIFDDMDNPIPAASIALDKEETYGQQTKGFNYVYERGHESGQHVEEHNDISDQVANHCIDCDPYNRPDNPNSEPKAFLPVLGCDGGSRGVQLSIIAPPAYLNKRISGVGFGVWKIVCEKIAFSR